MKDLGPRHYYLGMKIDLNLEAQTLTISQFVYAQKALESMGMQDRKSAATPMAENLNLVNNPETAKPSTVRVSNRDSYVCNDSNSPRPCLLRFHP